MVFYVAKRFVLGVPMLIGLSVVLFMLLQLAPGDPAIYFIPADVTDPTQIERIRKELGLTDSIPEQYLHWLNNVVQADFGDAYSYGEPVTKVISARLLPTLQLQVVAITFSFIIAIPLGIAAAIYRQTWIDRSLTTGSLFGLSMPDFWFGLLLILFFSLKLGWFPTSGNGGDASMFVRWRYFVMPVLVLGLSTIPWYSRFMRSSLIQVRSQDYIRAARARGLSEARVLIRHSLKPASLPVLTILALSLTRLIGGSVIVEVIFAWPGLGRLAYDSILRQDFPVVMALTLLVASSVILINIILDVTYTLVDPRISYGASR